MEFPKVGMTVSVTTKSGRAYNDRLVDYDETTMLVEYAYGHFILLNLSSVEGIAWKDPNVSIEDLLIHDPGAIRYPQGPSGWPTNYTNKPRQ